MKLLIIIRSWKTVSLLVSCILLLALGCAQTAQKTEPADGYILRLKPLKFEEETKLISLAHTKTFLRGKIRHEKIEEASFKLQSKLVNETNDGILTFEVRTIEKEGFVNLREMAFPEIGEAIKISYQPNGKVIQAGQYPADSIFYVPPVSLPKHKVKVGDTWKLSAKWMSSSNRLPLELKILTIFKETVSCSGGTCARLEVSGAVEFASKALQKIEFESQIAGEILFHLDEGRVVHSVMHNLEILHTKDTEVVVKSCLRSKAAEKGKLGDDILSCKPREFDGENRRPSIFQKYY